MNIIIDRKWKKPEYTIGNMYIDDVFFSNTLEDVDRGLYNHMPLSYIKSIKIDNMTAIPYGTYTIDMDTVSNKYSSIKFYKDLCDGKLPRLCNVKGFDGILIHCGNTTKDTSGCILVGKNSVKGGITDSRNTFKKLYNILYSAHSKGDIITLTIK